MGYEFVKYSLGAEVVQTTGDSEKAVMSQKAVTDELKLIEASVDVLDSVVRGTIDPLTLSWKDIQNIVREGLAAELFKVGDQLIVPWTDVAANVTYEVPLDIVHFGNVTLEDGSVVPAMFLQWHYCTPFGVQFDHPENEVATESTFLADYSYYVANDSGFTLLVEGTDYTVGEAIPTDTTYYHSVIKDTTGAIVQYGYNRWSHSAVRQFLNSAKGVNEWWTAQHLGDVAPEQLATNAGFMSGFDEEFLSCLKPIKVTMSLNTVTDTEIGTTEDTFDTFFLPSLEQIYAKPELAGVEGEPFEYWRLAVGKTEPNGWYGANANPAYITYALDAKTSAQHVRLRSASHNYSYTLWIQSSDGILGNSGSGSCAYSAYRFAPVCAIC